jgi:hypothetical protein
MAIRTSSKRSTSSPASHLSHRDRVRGGRMSVEVQKRDSRGHFAGRSDDSRRARPRATSTRRARGRSASR